MSFEYFVLIIKRLNLKNYICFNLLNERLLFIKFNCSINMLILLLENYKEVEIEL